MADRDDIEARALDALPDDETRAFDARADAATRSEVDGMRDVLGMLAEADATEPPADMRARVLAQLSSTPQEAPAAADAAAPSHGAEDAVEDAPPDGTTPAGPRERAARRRWLRRPVLIAGAAAAAAVVLVGGIAIGQWTRPVDPISALVHASDVESVTAQLPDGSFATVLWSADRGDAAVMFDELTALEDGQVYEAWFIRGDDAVAAGIFEAESGTAVHVLDGTMEPGDVIGVTIEPAGGSEAPTSDPILVAETA